MKTSLPQPKYMRKTERNTWRLLKSSTNTSRSTRRRKREGILLLQRSIPWSIHVTTATRCCGTGWWLVSEMQISLRIWCSSNTGESKEVYLPKKWYGSRTRSYTQSTKGHRSGEKAAKTIQTQHNRSASSYDVSSHIPRDIKFPHKGATNHKFMHCGQPKHKGDRCPVKSAECHKCHRKGHCSSQCFSKMVADSVHSMEAQQDSVFIKRKRDQLDCYTTSSWQENPV